MDMVFSGIKKNIYYNLPYSLSEKYEIIIKNSTILRKKHQHFYHMRKVRNKFIYDGWYNEKEYNPNDVIYGNFSKESNKNKNHMNNKYTNIRNNDEEKMNDNQNNTNKDKYNDYNNNNENDDLLILPIIVLEKILLEFKKKNSKMQDKIKKINMNLLKYEKRLHALKNKYDQMLKKNKDFKDEIDAKQYLNNISKQFNL